MESSLVQALPLWAAAIGAEHVLTSERDLKPYLANVSGLRRQIPAVLRPGSTADVLEIVRVANQCRTPLYPISTGRNLGLGSRVPVSDGQVVIDLGRMNRILEVNAGHYYAVVEPGVTQGQLADHLAAKGLPLIVNVTGAGRNTSLIGNTLERGIGYFATRADTLTAMEVVLGNGRLLRTGFGHIDGAKTAHIYRHGIGPDLSGLFSQSNYGVVTSAGVPLLPKREHHVAAVFSIVDERQLPQCVDALGALRARDVIQTVVHLGNRNRTHLAMGASVAERLAARGVATSDLQRQVRELLALEGFGVWSAVWGIMGTRAQVRVAQRETARALRGQGRLIFLSEKVLSVARAVVAVTRFTAWGKRKALIVPGLAPYFGLATGTPTDEPLKSLNWALGVLASRPDQDPDSEGWGMLYCLPFIPLDGALAQELVMLTNQIYGRFGFEAYVTFNMVDQRALEAVINLAFDAKSGEHVARAHEASHALHEACVARGWMPYRVGVQEMGSVIDPADEFWKTVRDLKQVLDPNRIIAPGRYNLV
ncbi:MAG: FAD-binding oxidoreductase [Lentisphaerae bacterium]|nr:FAD-binding oxidoreductase [Lentisphaerota bacterium]